MAGLSLGLLVAFGVVCIGLRTAIHVRRTGTSPFRDGPAGSGRVAVIAFALPFVGAAVLDATDRGRLVDGSAFVLVGTALACIGIGLTMWSQLAMGESWRIGVDEEERTALVTRGPYRAVRNPIYTGMFVFAAGLTLLVPNLLSVVGLAASVLVISLVVRRVEEPHLAAMHRADYAEWAGDTGRFLPGIGAITVRQS